MSIKEWDFFRFLAMKWRKFRRSAMPSSLFGRSMLILVMPVVLTLGIGLFFFFDRHWRTTTANLTNSLAGEVAFITDGWQRGVTPEERLHLMALSSEKLGLQVRFSFIERLPKARALNVPGVYAALDQALHSRIDNNFSIVPDPKGADVIIVNVAVPDGVLQIFVQQKRLFSTTTYVFLLIMVGSGLFLSLIAVVFMRNQIRPVRKLAMVAEAFGKGVDVPRFTPGGAREVRQAALAFMDMRDRIKRQINQRTDMLSGVSHDLRTPLTRLKLELAMLPPSVDVTAMKGDINAMEKMIGAYLDFAKGEVIETSAEYDILAILRQCISDARRQNLSIDVISPHEPVILRIRPQAIARVFSNIFENTRLYAHRAWVSAEVLSRNIEIIIDDDGPGIDPALREEIFRPFRRGDAARNQNIEGTGLGLTIAQDFIQSHGGTISLDTSPHGGLRVIILLPL